MRGIILIVLFLSIVFLFAGGAGAETIMERVQNSADYSSITDEVDTAGSNIIELGRQVAVTVAVVLGMYTSYLLFFSGANPNNINRAKVTGLLTIVALMVAFRTETIIGGILGLLGIKI